MSEDSLMNENEPNISQQQSMKSSRLTANLDEHIKLVKQKKDEFDHLRLQRFQEQLRKKEQKSQEQQIERVKKWLQLRNRDSDHRVQVEERRRKLEDETKAKFDEILRREKEREQRTVHVRALSYKPECLMSISTDIVSSRRATSAPRIRTNHNNMNNRRTSTDSQDNADHSASAISSHQITRHQSRHSRDATMTTEENSVSGTMTTAERTSTQNRTRQMPTSYSYWINSGDNQNSIHANFMRSTYAASCRSRLSRSAERCPRACRGHHDETSLNTTMNSVTSAATTTTANGGGDSSQRRVQSVNRQQLNETIRRLSKPKAHTMTQSVQGMPSSQSSHQLRASTPNQHLTSTPTRRQTPSRPATAPTNHVSVNNLRASPHNELTTRQSPHRTPSHSRPPTQSAAKPPVARSKPPVQRSLMTTSLSSSALSSSTTKQNIRRIGGTPPSSPKPKPQSPVESLTDSETSSKPVEEQTPVEPESISTEIQPTASPPAESIDTATEIVEESTTQIESVAETSNPPPAQLSKREQDQLDEQEYQRKLNQKIREAQQRLEAERQREEERQRQLELEEYEREQEQIRLAEEQHRVEQERLQRAIEERERENELKRQEEQRLQQQREELERKQAEETERLNRERQERAKKEEEERNERKRRLDLIMRRTRPVSPTPKTESNGNSKTSLNETNDHDQQPISSMSHSISDNRFPTSLSIDNLNSNDSTPAPETPKFKSPLIQSLLERARNSRSTDNLSQSNMTTSQIQDEIDTHQTIQISLSDDDDDQHDSGINNTLNGHTDSPLSSSTY